MWRRRRKRMGRARDIDTSEHARRPEPSSGSGSAATAGTSTVTAVLEDGPLRGTRIETEVVEGRPPKTLDLEGDEGGTCRYGLSDWVQSGQSAKYSFLYRV